MPGPNLFREVVNLVERAVSTGASSVSKPERTRLEGFEPYNYTML